MIGCVAELGLGPVVEAGLVAEDGLGPMFKIGL